MRIPLTIILFLFLSGALLSQTKYFIYFKDKGADAKRLNKSSQIYLQAEKLLTQESIERRKQVMGDDYITYDDLPVNDAYVKSIESFGVKIIHRLKWFNAVSCYLNDEQTKQIQSLPFVKNIEAVRSFKRSEPVEESLNIQPVLQKTNSLLDYGPSFTQNNLSEIPIIHDFGITGEGVIVGLLDTGFRRNHPALQSVFVNAEKDFINNDNNTANENDSENQLSQDSHGTAVLSIIGGNAPGKLLGPAFKSKYVLAKTEDLRWERNIEEDNYAAALEWMESQGVHITSSSLGYSEFDVGQISYTYSQMDGKTTKVAQSANYAFERGVTTITSAGNEGSKPWRYITSPADAFEIISVGAVNYLNNLASFSSKGPSADGRIKPELVAQGTEIVYAISGTSNYAIDSKTNRGMGSGTSYSAPIVAGIAALLKSAFPHLTNKQIRQIMIEAGDNVASPNNERGYGLISAKRAISYPNINYVNGQPVINKAFILNGGINENTLKIYIREVNQNFVEATMTKRNSYSYTYSIPQSLINKNIEFYFTYSGNNGQNYREPQTNYFRFKYGSLVVDNILTDVKSSDKIPSEFKLEQNYPNPFNPVTNINYSVSEPTFVTLKIYDFLGREISTLVNEYKQPGTYNSQFSIRNSQLSSGVYIYTLKAGNFVQSKKMILLK